MKTNFWSFLTFVTVAILAVPYSALGAGRPVGSSGTVRLSSSPRQPTHSQGFHHSRFFGGDGIGGAEVTLEQSLPTPIVEPEKLAKKYTYVQPHWVNGGYGVELLAPGYWVDTEKESRR